MPLAPCRHCVADQIPPDVVGRRRRRIDRGAVVDDERIAVDVEQRANIARACGPQRELDPIDAAPVAIAQRVAGRARRALRQRDRWG
jgi:hypothetical protein